MKTPKTPIRPLIYRLQQRSNPVGKWNTIATSRNRKGMLDQMKELASPALQVRVMLGMDMIDCEGGR
jgi:hypothetical protein